jgi:hypothetical protein
MIVGATAIAAHAAPAVALEKPADLADVTAAQPGSFFPTVGFSVNGELPVIAAFFRAGKVKVLAQRVDLRR